MAVVSLRRRTSIPFPVDMRLKLADGSTADVELPVEIWARSDHVDAAVPVRGRVTGLRLWPHGSVPDWDAANDAWGDAPAADPTGPVTTGGLTTSTVVP
jgi:hypothetical protein